MAFPRSDTTATVMKLLSFLSFEKQREAFFFCVDKLAEAVQTWQ